MKLEYDIIYSDRKTLNISVERDRKIIVRAPKQMSEQQVQSHVESKKLWLFDKLNHHKKFSDQMQQKEFVSGETFMYLGRNYQLLVSDNPINGVEFDHKFIISRENREKAKQLFEDWYRRKSKEKIIPRAKRFAELLGVKYKEIKISDMQYRWGSCTPKNNINFNWRLIKAPWYVIDYLIVHELSHLIEANHTPDFWNLVSIHAPRYKEAKEWLIKMGDDLFVDF